MSETTGVVFDIKEFALYDGPGLRCTVFMKGCPLRCSWCHNPEGLDPFPEIMRTAAGERRVGETYAVSRLVHKLERYLPLFAGTDGGITFSGGEPLMQADFVREAMLRLGKDAHCLLQTSGFAPEDVFLRTAAAADLVYFDVKIMDPARHKRYTGRDNAPILANLAALGQSGVKFRLRFPAIPGVTDDVENYRALRDFIARRLAAAPGLEGLDILPYNVAAGGKYQAVGRTFKTECAEAKTAHMDPDFFTGVVREVKVL